MKTMHKKADNIETKRRSQEFRYGREIGIVI